jgi:methionyl-tRNA formyltransferase
MIKEINWAFFGSSEFSVTVLETIKGQGYKPNLIITIPDKPRGRKMILTKEEVKVWAEKNNIPCIQLKSLRTPEAEEEIRKYFKEGVDLFVVTHYGKIIPNNILNIPRHKTLNIHPSLLPKLRGPSPIKSAILSENETGVTIIRLDEEMDHGPVILQEKIKTSEWPPYESELSHDLAVMGGEMISKIIPDWIDRKINEIEQDHSLATLCTKIEKQDGQIDLSDDAEINLRKIRAYEKWPGAFYFDNDKRIKITKARVENGLLKIEKVIPEGKKEMSYDDYLRGKN